MIVSLCTGYGGLDLAAQHVTGLPVAYVADNDRNASRILAARWPDAPNLGDVREIDWASLDRPDVLTAGYPCQPFSYAGRRHGEDDPRHVWPHIASAVRALRPRLVLLENVRGHLSRGFGAVLGDLAAAGYDARWTCLRACDVGALHRRARVFVAAAPDSHGVMLDRRGHERASRRAEPTDGGRPLLREFDRWGEFEPAVRRWEEITGHAAPRPIEPGRNGERLSPRFVEWLQGLPAGWVTDVPGIARTAQITALGNGVVPQQAVAALDDLLDRSE